MRTRLGGFPAAMRLHKGKTARMTTAAREQPTSSITYGRLRRLLCSHRQIIHGSAATRCASCGQQV
jgi:ribosomal protein S27E